MIEVVKQIIQQNDLCVLATTDGDRPHTSLMAYINDDNCQLIYLVTSRDTRKYRNLTANPNISLLIDDREAHPAPQRGRIRSVILNGTAKPVDEARRAKGLLDRFSELRPHLDEIVSDQSVVVVEIAVDSFLLLDGVSRAHFLESS
jgi:nitroimidazol reductase NimA-like FMN-containing flavoprotein (pyridoxamine 5'-phosphate oxidase superfamily)